MCSTLFLQICKQKNGKRVMIPLPISMHTGQIIMMTKIMTGSGMAFYDFVDAKAVVKWKSETST